MKANRIFHLTTIPLFLLALTACTQAASYDIKAIAVDCESVWCNRSRLDQQRRRDRLPFQNRRDKSGSI